MMIGLEEIKIEEEEMKNILEQLTLKEVKDIQKFLGLINYYQQFIKNFAAIARLIHNMVKKNQKQEQIERQEKAFQELKKRLTKESVLVALNLNKKNKDKSRYIRLCNRGIFILSMKISSEDQ